MILILIGVGRIVVMMVTRTDKALINCLFRKCPFGDDETEKKTKRAVAEELKRKRFKE